MRLAVVRFALIGFAVLAILNEYLVYILKPVVSWPAIKCNKTEHCTKILLVADPQILGEYKENFLARFDSDRYLRNTFTTALQFVKPDGIIFLGDLFDEGSVATTDQFNRYCNRFHSIFQLEKLTGADTETVFIPGDNDIGGENNEIIRSEHVARFRKKFDTKDIHFIKDVQITKVNKLLRTYPVLEDKSSNGKFKLNIAVSHMPLSTVISPFTEQVILNVRPEFIFSAHDHKSYALLTLKEDGKMLYYEDMKYNAFKGGISTWTFQAAKSTNYSVITEIVVPTCSYRMGSADVGYGVIIHGENSEQITYHVLWLPSRLPHLWLYVIFISISSAFIWCNCSSLRRLYFKYCK
ncbi:uncharacterized protein Mppe isoform X2 [Planococcus citri]|uniref:uncharacterized protein Mppe isoform X2 n=1 Tax=Planococcus citri TaxID=170843 RepID=UPI0031F888AA